MSNKVVTFLFCFVFIASLSFAQNATRGDSIPVPEPENNMYGAIGNILTDVDFDNDGLTDVFMVNNNWNDVGGEVMPRLYKYENGENGWEIVWSCSLATAPAQATWAPLIASDLDGDGLQEIIWAPPTDSSDPNDPRLFVFEEIAKEGNDALGVADGFGNYLPNASTYISETAEGGLRPFRFVVEDFDHDGTQEIIFADRRACSTGSAAWFYGVISVDTIPDLGDGSETWTVESNGTITGLTAPAECKWDLAVLDSVIFLFDEVRCDRVKWDTTDGYHLLSPQPSVLKGAGSWKSAIVADIDGNAEKEIIVGTWYTSVDGGHGVYVYHNVGDSLVGAKVADLSAYMDSYGVYGGALGDVDLNGKMDYVFGSRDATPNAAIFRLEYNGGQDAVTEPANWVLSVIDSGYTTGGRWDVIAVANIDDDLQKEVLYTTGIPAGGGVGTDDLAQPVIVLNFESAITPGPWQQVDVPYEYKDVFASGSSVHGVVVDKYNRVWVANYYDHLRVYLPDGTEDVSISPIDSFRALPLPAGGDTTIPARYCGGMAVMADGNIIWGKYGSLVKVDVNTGLPLDWLPYIKDDTSDPQSPFGAAVDDDGFIYVGKVIGVNPIKVLNGSTFDVEQEITLDPLAGGYGRGMYVSNDGSMLIPGNLDATIHPLYIYETTDFVNYPRTDSIYANNLAAPIFTTQSVTLDRGPDGKAWVSQDDSYGAAGPNQTNNSLVMFDFDTYQYGYLYMPEPRTAANGPRGAAWSATGDTIYVASWNASEVYRYTRIAGAIANNGELLPQKFELAQNYPNPFNPKTKIKFRVAKAGRISLTVYNILGQKVEKLVDQNLPIGNFTVDFDASKYASGTYIYELKADDVKLTKKMMLLK